jgi:hypothetical protein
VRLGGGHLALDARVARLEVGELRAERGAALAELGQLCGELRDAGVGGGGSGRELLDARRVRALGPRVRRGRLGAGDALSQACERRGRR